MSITRNPFGVGESGEDLIPFVKRCSCCGLRFSYKTSRTHPQDRQRCSDCTSHRTDGSAEEVVAVLRAHDAKVRAWAVQVEAKANDLEREKNLLSAKLNALQDGQRSRRQDVAAAYESRDRYRDVTVALSEFHQDAGRGNCSCGDKYPCRTMQAARRADPRIAQEMWPATFDF